MEKEKLIRVFVSCMVGLFLMAVSLVDITTGGEKILGYLLP